MDWWKLFALLIALTGFFISAEAAKKKIRIHLPQKVKHIHHHKKIYITNHPASSQYAPAYLPTADGSVAVPSTVSLPIKSVDLFDDGPASFGSGSKLLPLYKARGYYGPQPSEQWDEQEYDLVPPPEPTGPDYVPSAFSAPSAPEASSNYAPKRVKVIKIKQSPRKKKAFRKRKPKRVIPEPPPVEEDHPVSSYHEKFYSDLDSAGTIKKIKKPKRVEKVIDGDTEHIHTYSEEHIHKVVYDDSPKISGAESISSMSALAGGHPILPIKNHHSILALDGDMDYSGLSGAITHDHVFHDHGEMPPHLDLNKGISYPPRASYTSQGLKIGVDKRYPGKYGYRKPRRPGLDLSYYENMYSANGRPKKVYRPNKLFGDSSDDYRSPYKKSRSKTPGYYSAPYYGHNHNSGKHSSYHVGQPSSSIPFSTSTTVFHDVNPSDSYKGSKPNSLSGFSNFKDPFTSFKNLYSNNLDFDTYASSSASYREPNNNSQWRYRRGKNKSVSTQNINFGGHDHKTIVDHLADSSHVDPVVNDDASSQIDISSENDYDNTKIFDDGSPTSDFTLTENDPGHDYYTAMALKAFQDQDPLETAEASNDNFQFAEAPSSPATLESAIPSLTSTTAETKPHYRTSNSETTTPEPSGFQHENREYSKNRRPKTKSSSFLSVDMEGRPKFNLNMNVNEQDQSRAEHLSRLPHRQIPSYRRARGRLSQSEDRTNDSPSARGKFKYGDKI